MFMKQKNDQMPELFNIADDKHFVLMYNKYYDLLCWHAKTIVGVKEDAECIVHDFFETLWKNRRKIQITTSLNAYLYHSVRNACINHLKHKKIMLNHSGQVLSEYDYNDWIHTHDHNDPQTIMEWQETKDKIEKLIATFPSQCREVALLRLKEYGNLEIANELGISEKAVSVQIDRMKKKLKAADIVWE